MARRHGVAYVVLAMWCALVWYLSSKPDPGDTVGFFIDLPDYILHGAEFAAGGLVAARAFSHLRNPLGWLTALIFCVLFGVLDEWHQSYVPGRCADFKDVLADSIGASFGVALHALIARTTRV
jgi:VanZ family protein